MSKLLHVPCLSHLELLLATMPTIAFTLNEQGVFTMVQGCGLVGTGLMTNEFVGTSVFEMGTAYPTILANIRSALAGRSCTALEAGLGCTFATSYHPLYDHHQRVMGVIGVGIEVTQPTSLADGAARLHHDTRLPDPHAIPATAHLVDSIDPACAASPLTPREIAILRCVAQGLLPAASAIALLSVDERAII